MLKMIVAGLVAAAQVLTPTAHAQSADAQAPIIEVEQIISSEAAASQVFTAQVADDRQLRDVALYHRRSGQQAFTRLEMLPVASTDFYSATVPTKENDLRNIEYYVQARDEGGNRSVSGFAFDPLVRTLSARPIITLSQGESAEREREAIVPPPDQTPARIESGGSVAWWHVALGVLAVGALAAAAGGSGGSSDDGTGTVPLTVTLGEPQ